MRSDGCGQRNARRGLLENSRERCRSALAVGNRRAQRVRYVEALTVDDESRDLHSVGDQIHAAGIRGTGPEDVLIEPQHHRPHRRVAVVAERDSLPAGHRRCRGIEPRVDLVVGPELPVVPARAAGGVARPRRMCAPNHVRHRDVASYDSLRGLGRGWGQGEWQNHKRREEGKQSRGHSSSSAGYGHISANEK